MFQSYKIFINNIPLVLAGSPEALKMYVAEWQGTREQLEEIFASVIKNGFPDGVLLWSRDPGRLRDTFFSIFKLSEAAGGVVRDPRGRTLFIFRKGRWDLPKGKLEAGEDAKDGAVREVMEETGLGRPEVTGLLGVTWHIFSDGNNRVLKKTSWFGMRCGEEHNLVPQAEEGITQVRWVGPDEMPEVLQNTFASIRELMRSIKN